MAIESRRLYPAYVRELEDSTGSAIDYQECGGLDVAYSSEELAALDERARLQTSIGIQSRPVSLEQIAAFWPRLRSEGLAGARFYPGDAIVNPREVLSALMTACHRSGVCIVENCGVRLVEVTGERVTLETSRGREQHSAIAIAAGAWSHSIIVEGVPRLPPSEPVKGHLIAYQEAEQVSRTIVRHAHTYLLQRSSGALIVGASVEHVGFDRDVKPEIVSELAEHAAFVLPHLRGTAPTDSWIGFRPGSDALHIGPWHSKRLYLAYGHFRNGILLAPWTARQIVGEVSANLGRH